MPDPGRTPSAPVRLYAEWLAVALIATLLVTGLVLGRVTERLDHIVYDLALTASGRPPPDDIVIVAIDNRSLQAIGRWPWPRRIHAEALNRLAEAKPRAVGYDVLFVEPTADDEALAAAVRRSRTYLPMVIDVPGTDGAAYDMALPSGPLTPAAAGIVQVNLHFDGDRVIRQAYLEEGGSGHAWMQLAATMAGLSISEGAGQGKTGLWQERPVLIPYSGAAGHIRTISFIDLLEGRTPPELIADRYVLVGATADGMGDGFPTPTSGETSQMAGVEIQAQLLDALLRGEAIRPASAASVLAFALGAAWALLFGFLRLSPRGNAHLAVGLSIAILVLTFGLFRFAHIWLPPTPALIGLLFLYPLWGWRRLQVISSYMTEELIQLAGEQDDFPRAGRNIVGAREVTLQVALLGAAIARLRDLRRFLSDSLRNLPDAIFVTDRAGRIRLTNGEGRRLLRRLSLAPDMDADLHPLFALFRYAEGNRRLAPFDPDAEPQAQAEVTLEGLGSYDVRYVAQADANDLPVGTIIRIVDLTQLKRAERHREEALQLLSHDMRAPQSAILTLLQNGGCEIPPALSKRIQNYARRTLDLAEDFVQLARAEDKPLAIAEIDLNDIVIDAADDLWPQAHARRIRIDVSPCDDLALALGDRQLLTRAMINLIGNAIKYSDAGTTIGCTITMPGDGMIHITIADQGAGMTEDQLANLFGRFQQGPREGVGLGLALVRLVVERHRGTIACQSEAGVGTTFTIDLPTLEIEEV